MRSERWLALALLAACSGDGKDGAPPVGVEVQDLRAEPLVSMPTVLEVRWTTAAPSKGVVLYSVTGEPERATDEQPEGTEHRALLVGLPQNSPITLRVDLGDDGSSDELEVQTGPLPVEVPPLTVTGDENDLFTTTSIFTETTNKVVILDPQGRVTWLYEDRRGLSLFRARPTLEGDGVVYLSSIVAGGPSPDSEIVRVSWAGVETEVLRVPNLAHDFVEMPDGSFAALAYEERVDDVSGEPVLGNAILSVPRYGAEPTPIWTSWDCFDPNETPGDDPAQGWTHTNALDYDEAADEFLVGLRNFDAIAAVDPATAECRWTLGGPAGDLDVSGEAFHHSHQFERTADGLLVFDNDGAQGFVSRVLEYSLDLDQREARQVGEIVADPPLFSFILGDVHRATDGSTMVVWSVEGTMDRYGPSGDRVFRVEGPESAVFGFAWWTDELRAAAE